jgi:DNA-binding transcriptional MerR regulator
MARRRPDAVVGLRIEALARAAGVSTRNIRAYQSLGLLAPPTLVGRVGYYGPAHAERLHAIARLQARGFSLAAVRALFDARAAGRTLDELLGSDTRRHDGGAERVPAPGAELFDSLRHWRGPRTELLPEPFVARHLVQS